MSTIRVIGLFDKSIAEVSMTGNGGSKRGIVIQAFSFKIKRQVVLWISGRRVQLCEPQVSVPGRNDAIPHNPSNPAHRVLT